MGVSGSEMLQPAEYVTKAAGGAWGWPVGKTAVLPRPGSPGPGPRAPAPGPSSPSLVCRWDLGSGRPREQHSWSWDLAQGCLCVPSCVSRDQKSP